MKKKIIEFKDFSFQYRVQAEPTVKNINLSIYEGEKVLIVGPSGSGKSTLAHCINGLVPFFYDGIVTGQLNINGNDATKMNIFELSKIVGTVLQDPDSQFIGLTVGEDIAFKLENYCISQDEMIDRVDKSAELVDIKKELYSSPYKLSGGQKQRVTLAGVTVDDVKILLFDEPLASLDPATGESAIELIDKMQKQNNKTAIIIEHRLEDVLHCAVDRVIVVNNGEIAADITPAELLSSNILSETGIREPLYITALKYAGCTITPEMKPEHIDTLNIDLCREKLKTWYEETSEEEKQTTGEAILEMKDVKFSYESGKEILHGVSFKVNKGETIAFIGSTGSGKSTLINLIPRFYDATSGEILINGIDVRDYSFEYLNNIIGYVPQKATLFSGDVLSNVSFGKNIDGKPSNKKIADALRVSQASEFVSKLEDGKKSHIAQGGTNISGGQKQRLSIARTIARNPEIYIFDDSFSALDYKTDSTLRCELREYTKDATVMIVAQRIGTILNADKIVVLDNGKCVGVGTHNELMKKCKVYKEIALSQVSKEELENV